MNIRIDEKNLTAASVMPLFEAAQKIADMTGELVTINAYDGIKFEPATKAKSDNDILEEILRDPDHTQVNMVEPHKWPDLNDWRPREGRDDGWIKWDGGECPVPFGTMVDVKHRDGEIHENVQAWGELQNAEQRSIAMGGSPAGAAFWRHDDSLCDIIAYRLHKPEVKASISTTESMLLKDQAN